jgi:hypothetical protein
MNPVIEDYINLEQRLAELDCQYPASFCFLPENIQDAASAADFVFPDTVVTAKKLFRQHNIPEDVLCQNDLAYRKRHSIDWYAPAIFISYTILSDNSALVSIGFNVLSNYITDYFKGTFGSKTVKIEIVVETSPKRKYKKIQYEGTEEGLKNLPEIIKSLQE